MLTEINMKVIGMKEENMVMEFIILNLEQNMMEIGKKILKVVKERFYLEMEISIQENG